MAVQMPKVSMPSVTGGFEDQHRQELGLPLYPVSMPQVKMPGTSLDGPPAPDPSVHTEKTPSYVSKLAGLSGAKPASKSEQFVNGFGDPMTDYYAQVKDPRQSYADSQPMIEHNLHDPMWDEFLTRLSAASTKNTKPATGAQ